MTAIWKNDGTKWSLLSPTGFPSEADLHDLIDSDPQLLPLAGSPQLTIVGSKVTLGNNQADLIAVESSGRLVVIEVKLERNSEARRAVVAQVLTYAAFLRGVGVDRLQSDILGGQLGRRGYGSLEDAVATQTQDGSFDRAAFHEGLQASLAGGHFRLVLVLDEAPKELVRLVGYLDSITENVVIDLVTVTSYQVGDSRVLVPQHVDPEHQTSNTPQPFVQPGEEKGQLFDGADEFTKAIASAPQGHREFLEPLRDWTIELQKEGLIRLKTYRNKGGGYTLLPRLRADDAGLVTIWYQDKYPSLQFWLSVFQRRAPNSIALVEAVLGEQLTQSKWIRTIPDGLLPALTNAYREAAQGKISGQADR